MFIYEYVHITIPKSTIQLTTPTVCVVVYGNREYDEAANGVPLSLVSWQHLVQKYFWGTVLVQAYILH